MKDDPQRTPFGGVAWFVGESGKSAFNLVASLSGVQPERQNWAPAPPTTESRLASQTGIRGEGHD